MARVTKYFAIAEVISVVLFLLCLAGGMFLDESFWLIDVCKTVAQVTWITTELSMLGLIVLLFIYSMQLLFQMIKNPGSGYGMLSVPDEKPKQKMPWFLIVLAFAWFFVFWVVVVPLMSQGA